MMTSKLPKCFQVSVPYASDVQPAVRGRVMSEAETNVRVLHHHGGSHVEITWPNTAHFFLITPLLS